MRTCLAILTILAGTVALAQTPDVRGGNAPPLTQPPAAGVVSADTVVSQVMLDRAHFSPGEIDGRAGDNFTRAVAAFQRATGLPESGQVDLPTQERLNEAAGNQPAFVQYEVRETDVAGPFTPGIPDDLVAQSKLDRLSYQNPLEAIAERFHTNPQLLTRINPGIDVARAGARITVPNVEPFEVPQPPPKAAGRPVTPPPPAPAFTIAVTKSTSALTVEDPDGHVVFHAPVTTGSDRDPLPIGSWKVTTVQVMPAFHYNPALFWDADPSHSKATIQPGPNNPVGVAWIDLTKEHYGIHGTPQPSRIGHVQSHGCVRLTNWDVSRLLRWAQPGTPVVFRE